jgi:hypothetical protein
MWAGALVVTVNARYLGANVYKIINLDHFSKVHVC